MQSKMDSSKEHKKIEFHLTGFGPFHGVDDNPTKSMISHLKNEIFEQNLNSDWKNAPFEIKSCTVLETSGVGSLLGLCEVLQKHQVQNANKENKKVIFVHFGVSSSSKEFKLETVAWNEADFRVADERGWSPVKQLIIPEDKAIDHSVACPLPLEKIKEELVKAGYQVDLSTDPGRFVCNWIYYQSQHFSQINGTTSLFVHVPPFEVIPFEKQKKFYQDLLHTIATVF